DGRDRQVDGREDVDRHPDDREHAENEYQDRGADERVRAAQGENDDLHHAWSHLPTGASSAARAMRYECRAAASATPACAPLSSAVLKLRITAITGTCAVCRPGPTVHPASHAARRSWLAGPAGPAIYRSGSGR